MRIPLSDGDHITENEFKLNNKNIHNRITTVESDISDNKDALIKLSQIVIGNGEGGLLWKVNTLMLRNHWVDKIFWVGVTIASNIFTLYLTGVLHL